MLEQYRAAESLGSDARARMLSGLRAKMAVGGPAAGGPTGSLKPALSKIAAAGKTKILLGVLAVAVPAAWMIHQSHRSVDYTLRTATPAVPAAPEVQPAPEATAAPSGTTVASAGGAVIPLSDLPPAPEEAPSDVRARTKRVASSPRTMPAEQAPEPARKAPGADEPATVTSPEPESAPASTLDQEMALLKRAHLAEKAGRPSEALALLAEHAKEFPNGKLAESRDVARIIALCEAGQTSASRSAAERFLAARPNSPFASRVRAVCANGENGR